MKKILSITVAAAAFATTVEAKGFNGFYAGMDFGMTSMNTNFKAKRPGDTMTDRVRATVNRPNLGIFLGYNKAFANCLTFGGVFTSDFNLTGEKNFVMNDRHRISQKRDYSWGLLATVGALVNVKSMVFIGLGIKSLKNKYHFYDYNRTSPIISIKAKSNKINFTTQIGHETLLANDNIALRVTYGFTPGISKKIPSPVGSFYYYSPNAGIMKFKTNEHQVKLGISYRF